MTTPFDTSNTLGKAQRLKSRKQIDALFAGGKSFFVHPVKVVYHLRKNNTPHNHELSDQSSTPNQTSDIPHPTSHIPHPTSDIPHQTSDIRHQTSDIRHPTSDIPHPTSHIPHPTSHIRHPTSDIPHQTSHIRHLTSHIGHPTSDILKFGVSASKRHFKKATHRNRIKRLLREAFRTQKQALAHALQQQACTLDVFFIYTHNTLPQFNALQATVATCLERLTKAVQKPRV
ncbi:MAG: ribonuclease P protein component [Bacteroidetes bacterium]|nr:MAG: ribonuclease P protein component [Bacteroidota bacterium]